jgi:endonuclease III
VFLLPLRAQKTVIQMNSQEKIDFLIRHFSVQASDVQSELQYENAFQLLVATMLAAQCTDKRVNATTPALFEAYPDPAAMSKATVPEILAYIKSISYPNSKSLHLLQMSKMIMEEFGGQVPDTMEGLTRLPGVGRKTANVVLAFAFGKSAMPVDTHVFRVAHRLGLVKDAPTPAHVEKQLTALIPEAELSRAHHWLLLHGRYVCLSRRPHCETCPLASICDSFPEFAKRST